MRNKMSEKLISVIVPIYNVEKYLKNCLDSILNQTYKNLEIILCDDGSTDTCPKICDEYAKKDSRIKVIHKKNGGLSDARNAGLEIATGEYITFVDSDDFLFSDMIEILYKLCEKYKAEFSMCQCVHCKESDMILSVQKPINPIENEEVFEKNEKMEAYLLSRKIDTVAWKKMYERNLFKNLRFPKGKLHEDTFIMHLLIDRANRVAITNAYGYVYRINSQSIMNSSFSVKRLASIEAHIVKKDFIEKKYPELYVEACAELIYACNFCLHGMAITNYYDKKIDDMLKELYHKFAKYYLFSTNASLKGKGMTIIALINVDLARRCVRIIERKK